MVRVTDPDGLVLDELGVEYKYGGCPLARRGHRESPEPATDMDHPRRSWAQGSYHSAQLPVIGQ